jgi:hypothetical protein
MPGSLLLFNDLDGLRNGLDLADRTNSVYPSRFGHHDSIRIAFADV